VYVLTTATGNTEIIAVSDGAGEGYTKETIASALGNTGGDVTVKIARMEVFK
jgi:hypothetical protein